MCHRTAEGSWLGSKEGTSKRGTGDRGQQGARRIRTKYADVM